MSDLKKVPFEIEDYYCGMVLIDDGENKGSSMITDVDIKRESIRYCGSWTDIENINHDIVRQYHPEYKTKTTLTKEKK